MKKIRQSNDYSIFLLFLLCFFLLFLLFRWVDFLFNQKYLQAGTHLELFSSLSNTYNTTTGPGPDPDSNIDKDPNEIINNSYNVNYTHSNNIDMPAFSKYTCENWCGPNSQCLFSREQCFSDVDCKGCKDLTAVNNYYDMSYSELDVTSYTNNS